jgi:hypothetical protein
VRVGAERRERVLDPLVGSGDGALGTTPCHWAVRRGHRHHPDDRLRPPRHRMSKEPPPSAARWSYEAQRNHFRCPGRSMTPWLEV